MKREQGLSSEESAALLNRPAKRPGRGRRVLMILGGTVLVLFVLVAFLPRLASPLLNGRTVLRSDRVNASIASSSLGWLGNQQVRLALTDAKAKPAGNLDVSIDRGLLALAGNWYNLGTIRVTGDAELREGAGATAPKPSAGGTTVSVTTDRIPLPKDLQARVEISLSKVGVIDASGTTVAELRDVKTLANIRVGEPLTIDFDAKSGASPIAAKIKIENWVQPDGSIHLDSASLAKNSPRINASIKMDDLSVALLDALLATATGQERHLKSILGNTVSFETQASGDFAGGSASLNLQSPGAQAKARLSLKDGVVSLVEPARATITSAGTRAILDNYVPPSSGGFVITGAPETELQIEELSLKLPTGGLDLRGARVRATATLANTEGTITLGEDQPASKVSIPAFRAALTSEDLAGVVRVTADAASTITAGGNTASGGDLKADVSASGLLDKSGAPRSGLPVAIDGRVALRGAATGILQPLVSGALASSGVAIALPRDIGPTADVDLTAKTEAGVIDVDVNARAQSAEAVAELRVTDQALAVRGKGVSLRLANAGAIAARALKSPSLSLAKVSGQMSVDIAALNLPLEPATRKPKLDQLAAEMKAALSGWSLSAQVPPGKDQVAGRAIAIDLRALSADMSLAPGKGAVVRVDSDASADGSPVKIAADFSLPHALDAFGTPKAGGGSGLAQKLGPALALGHLEISGLPATLADALPRSAETSTTLGALVREAVGDTVSISLDSAQDADAKAISVKANVQGTRASAGLSAEINQSAIVAAAAGKGTIVPGLLEALMSGNAADKPRLRAPASYSFSAEPLSIPLDGSGLPVLMKAGMLKVKASIAGQAIVQSGTQAYGVQDFAVEADLPLSALGEGAGGQAAVNAGGVLLSADGSAMGNLDAKAALPLGSKLTLAGPANVEVGLSGVNTAGLDRALGQPLLVSGALGPSATIRAVTRISPPAGAAIGVAEAFTKADHAADITLASQRLEIKKPLHARAEGDRLSLESPEPIAWTIDPAWFDRFVLGKGQGKSNTDLSLAAPARAELVVSKAVVARTNTERGIQGPAFPGIFALDATVRIPSLELQDSGSVRTQMGDAVLKVQSGPASPGQPVTLAFDLGFGKLAVVPDPAKAGPGGGTIKGTIGGISTPTGLIETSNPIITAKGDIRSLPSALVDAFSVKNGLPGEILGPSVNVALDAQNFSKAGGSVSFSAVSTETGAVTENGATAQRPRAEMSLKGNAQNGVLVAPLNITIRRVDLGLEKRLSDVLPMVADLEKRYEDRQAVISSPQLAIPLDGNTAKLNGTLNIDPGDARFKTSGTFGALLRGIKTKDQGKIFQRLKPLNLSIANGVVTYPRWAFPMGEFNMDIEGTVDLPQSYVDMVAWVPIGQLVEDVSGVFSRIPGVGTAGNMINQTTMVPIRFKGPMGQTKASPDAGLFGKNFIKNVSPEKAVDLIKDIFKRPK